MAGDRRRAHGVQKGAQCRELSSRGGPAHAESISHMQDTTWPAPVVWWARPLAPDSALGEEQQPGVARVRAYPASRTSLLPKPRRGGVPTAKLTIPAASTSIVPRPRLLDLLPTSDTRDTDDRSLTILSGPAGCGKTTLLTDWARRTGSDRAIAWLS